MNSKRLLAIFGIMVAVMVLTSSVVYSIDSGDSDAVNDSRSGVTITNFGGFIKEVVDSGYDYDGHGVTVAWTASSGCWSGGVNGTHPNDSDKKHMFDTDQIQDGNTPNRANDGCYQYHIFAGVTADISISNVNFVFTTADVDICGNTDWQGHKLGTIFRSAELQFKNTGKLTVSNCSFNATLVSPFSVEDSFTVTNCQFNNNWDTYAFKDIVAEKIEISGCQFENLGCAILIKGGTQNIQSIKITNNEFKNIDTSEWSDGAYKHGLIQIAANDGISYAQTSFTISGNSLTMAADPEDKFGIVRAINQTVPTETILNQIITQNTFNEFPFVRYCTTLMYIDPTIVNSVTSEGH